MCDFEELENWAHVQFGRCSLCGVRQQLVGAMEISHRAVAALERFELCAGCRATALNPAHRSVAEGGLRGRIAGVQDALCRFLHEVGAVEPPTDLAACAGAHRDAGRGPEAQAAMFAGRASAAPMAAGDRMSGGGQDPRTPEQVWPVQEIMRPLRDAGMQLQEVGARLGDLGVPILQQLIRNLLLARRGLDSLDARNLPAVRPAVRALRDLDLRQLEEVIRNLRDVRAIQDRDLHAIRELQMQLRTLQDPDWSELRELLEQARALQERDLRAIQDMQSEGGPADPPATAQAPGGRWVGV
jgi:hypothetical protein